MSKERGVTSHSGRNNDDPLFILAKTEPRFAVNTIGRGDQHPRRGPIPHFSWPLSASTSSLTS